MNKNLIKDDSLPMNAGRLKHLEMIQALISRMTNNSFLIKAWSLTLLTLILTLTLKDKNYFVVLIAFIPVLMFWVLDSYFLRQELMYRNLWNLKRNESQQLETDFSLLGIPSTDGSTSWTNVVFSKNLLLFHGSLFSVLILIMILVFYFMSEYELDYLLCPPDQLLFCI